MFNIYDFDGTIYDGDSTVDFYFYCLRKKPIIVFSLPLFFVYFLLYIFDIVDKTKMKEKFYLFLTKINNVDEFINDFWKMNYNKIKDFYLEKNHKNDIIISASPYFLLKPVCDKLKVKKLIASNVDKTSGIYDGNNCSGEEKVNRLNETFSDFKINEVYSDSYSDIPIFKLGKKAFLVKGNNITLINKIIEKKKKEKKKKYKYRYLLELLFILSCVCLSLFLVGEYDLIIFKYLVVISLIAGCCLVCFSKDSIYFKFNKKYYVISVIISFYFVSNLKDYALNGIIYLEHMFSKLVGITLQPNVGLLILSIGSVFCFSFLIYYLLFKYYFDVKKFFLNLDNVEKKFILVFVLFGSIIIWILYSSTTIFYRPFYKKVQFVPYDVIYTTDSGILTNTNVYMNIGTSENDLRQPLFGLFSLPFSMSAKFISSFLDFIPNSYYIVFGVIQLFLLGICLILIARMLNLKISKAWFYIFCCSTYTMFLFSFVFEQYIILLFYLILTIYIGYSNKMEVNYFYCGAVGTLITSGIVFPCISKFNNFKKWFYNICKCFFVYMFLLSISGQILLMFSFKSRLKYLMRFSGKELLFKDKLLQFLYFVRSVFVAPSTRIVMYKSVPRFWLQNINFMSILGIVILLLCLISLILNRKNKFALISFLWIIFSFVILCVVGWGTQENGLILYSLYFFWAYVSLIVMLIDKINIKIIKYILLIGIIIIMIYYNFNGLINVIEYGIKYFGL